MSGKRAQPPWAVPQPADGAGRPVLKLHNSLTRQKEVFVPQEGNRVTWYNCGPTVYDASHMGHARTYLTFDILRRVLRDYFGYDIFFVQNITDVDDKIIKRARQNHLYEKYVQEDLTLEQVLVDCNRVLKNFSETVKATTDPDKRKMQEGQISRLSDAVRAVEDSVKSGDQADARSNLLVAAKDLLSDWLDKERGTGVTENAIFSKLPKYWEEEFHKDMEALNVRHFFPICKAWVGLV